MKIILNVQQRLLICESGFKLKHVWISNRLIHRIPYAIPNKTPKLSKTPDMSEVNYRERHMNLFMKYV